MAKQDTDSTVDETLEDDKADVETGKPEDEAEETETKEDATEEEETESSEDDTEESDNEDETEEESEEPFQKRFTQLKGDNTEEYLGSLEEAYANSTTEANRIMAEARDLKSKVEAIGQIAANDPELAEKLEAVFGGDNAPKPPLDPTTAYMQQEMEKKMKSEYDSFVSAHPDLESDAELAKEVNDNLAVVRDAIWQREGRLVGMEEGLKKAWNMLDRDDSEEKTRMAAKEIAGQGRTTGGGKKATKSSSPLTEAQIKLGKKLGLSEEQMLKHYNK